MDEFDFDEAEKLVVEQQQYPDSKCCCPSCAQVPRTKNGIRHGFPQMESPDINMASVFGRIRLLPPFVGNLAGGTIDEESSSVRLAPSSDVLMLLQARYGMKEPLDSDLSACAVWTSPISHEKFFLKEFPLLSSFASSHSPSEPVYRFRKYTWGAGGPVAQPEPDVGPGFYPSVMKELSALRSLGSHCHIVSLLDFFVIGNSCADLAVIFVFSDWGNPLSAIFGSDSAKNRVATNPKTLVPVFQQILSGLRFIHSRRIIHRNLTSSSIKVDLSGRIRIGGFHYAIPEGIGLKSAPYPEEDFPLYAPDTYEHLAPEVLLGSNSYETSSDIWSIGILLVSLICGESIYSFDEPESDLHPIENFVGCSLPAIFNVFRIFGTPTEDTCPGFWKLPYYHFAFPNWPGCFDTFLSKKLPDYFRDLVRDTLLYDPTRRLRAAQLIAKYFKFAPLPPEENNGSVSDQPEVR